MAVASRVMTLREVADIAVTGVEFSFALRDFLDGFYARPAEEALRHEPLFLADRLRDGARLDAHLGAVAEHLCRERRWSVPAWSREAARFLPQPWFGMKTHNGRMLLLADSPSAFRVRNLFVSADALSRV